MRVGIVGAGNISQFHLEALSRVPNAQVIGVVDLDQKQAAERASHFDIPFSGTELKELIQVGVDVVHILTPPFTHADLSCEALESGVHVIVEKPMATSVEDCKRMLDAAKANKKYLTVNHSLIYDPFIQKTLNLVQKGAIGKVIAFDYFRSSDYPAFPAGALPPQYRDGGYPFRDIGIHGLYLMETFIGPIKDAHSKYWRLGGDPYLFADEWRCQIECERGSGQIWLSWNNRPLENRIVIHGTNGSITADLFSLKVSCQKKLPGPEIVSRVMNPMMNSLSTLITIPWNVVGFLRGRIRRYHGVQAFVEDFYRSLAKEEPPRVKAEDAMRVVDWNEQIATPADLAKSNILEQLSTKRSATILVTGGTGFIGSRLVQELLNSGKKIRLLSRQIPPPPLAEDDRIEFVIGDLGTKETVKEAMSGIGTVYHLGAGMRGDPLDFQRSTISGTKNIIEAAIEEKVAKFVYISSQSVLHATSEKTGPVDENWPLEPRAEERGAYTQTKLEAENLVKEAVENRKLPAIILRPGQVFGEGAPLLTGAVGRKIGPYLLVFGKGKTILPLIYVGDLIDAILAVGQADITPGTVVHLTDSEREIDQNTFIEKVYADAETPKIIHAPMPIVNALGWCLEKVLGLLGRQTSIRYRIQSSIGRLHGPCHPVKELTDWKPAVGVESGIERVLSAESKNQA